MIANAELQLASGERGGGLPEQRRANAANVVGVVGVIEDVECREPNVENLRVVAFGFCKSKIVVP